MKESTNTFTSRHLFISETTGRLMVTKRPPIEVMPFNEEIKAESLEVAEESVVDAYFEIGQIMGPGKFYTLPEDRQWEYQTEIYSDGTKEVAVLLPKSEEKKTDNELIAEFMGFTFAYERGHRVYNVPKGEDLKYKADKISHVKLLYDVSWDWLMPVVRKIAKLYYPNGIKDNPLYTVEFAHALLNLQIDTPIENVYAEVVRSIKWYSQNKEKP